ncbi:cytochrome ubiquinol oxidase subunit I [Candidatus Paracaedibacter symbiosus]|uniref:cytochrome ubiquinol oxidase subunit I n=1 Tax=Candidatus Paracaedibacter symbiosus TaxID=244582 RepID=UPI000AA26702|nr:cytochrome ubiquinol oxidase subunit I [Candidatus Paracaedibacter symbiosus]
MELVVDLSRLQFAITALYHFLFVPLTIGLSLLLAIMESVYVMTGKDIWRQMTKFWGVLFGINFAMGVATGITMEFQFGTNWAYYAHYVGDIFGVPLAIEGLMAFFLEATFIGLFFFGWNRLSKLGHLISTWMLAFGTNFSALWILIANAWMQNPVGAKFNPESMRMELSSFYEVFFNPVAQSKFVHTISAGYVTGSMFVMAISAFYLLHNKYRDIAKRSMTVAASFGFASALSVVVLGDESGYALTENQKMKIAAIEAMWETESAPAGLTLIGFPDVKTQTTKYEVRIPWALGIIATRSFNTPIPGIKELVEHAKVRIQNGMEAYKALQILKKTKDQHERDTALITFEANQQNLGYAFLLKRYMEDITAAGQEEIDKAASSIIPNVPVLFWSFRIMVGIGFFFILFFGYAFYLSAKRQLDKYKWFLRLAVCSLPLPWIAMELGWIVAEYGRQPWAIEGVLPTFLGVSSTSPAQVSMSLFGFILFYTVLLVVDVFLMVRYVKLGPVIVDKE